MKNNETFKKFLRGMYQIIVVGILLLPFRLLCAIYSIIYGLMATDMKGYYSNFIDSIRLAYEVRKHYVKYGSMENFLDKMETIQSEEEG